MSVSKIKPTFEFVIREDKPDMIGVCPKGTNHGAWYKREHVEKFIAKFKKDLDFWNELLEQFDNY